MYYPLRCLVKCHSVSALITEYMKHCCNKKGVEQVDFCKDEPIRKHYDDVHINDLCLILCKEKERCELNKTQEAENSAKRSHAGTQRSQKSCCILLDMRI